MKTKFLALLLVLILFSCEEVTLVNFTETNNIFNENAIVELNIPKAEGTSTKAQTINKVVENHIANMLVFLEEPSDTLQLDYAIENFDLEYKSFKDGFGESAMVWDASFDGEVTYQSPMLISIAINSYINSGGAHGNLNVTFFNFDASTGALLQFDDLFNDKEGLKEIVKTHFEEETKGSEINYFFGEPFSLPANIGFNDEGIVCFYNVYEIASYADGITEFTVPFEDVEAYLNIY
ncbi:DUF3298 and DUF4163 domain-containing protein [Flavobacteriaceae bacterium S0825]|uniref:DUF3298 and DUF4163 domain-containing protein n=1 Tax=Gaetbulibacter sp. S0825 TaxID=2720084 RepID=UPI00143038D6|nr:DUF3298 and DUF4163 domain-containing protein [Gaetbulibacter sp. S0825]MCK0108115.1 DUF3298 and DUF4163 domain-containing protein [Flavobacteriaceae bacterium S0825]NIX63751.1 DUF3298 and DUF4163 domain-containing protein [Gaetbulibacter sp. S0825]